MAGRELPQGERVDARAREARDVVAFGQEIGRVLSDGRIVGRAEPFAKVFPSSRAVKRAVGPTAWVILEDIALSARLDTEGRLVADTNVRRIARNLGLSKNTVTKHLASLRNHGFIFHEEVRDQESGRYETIRYVLDPSACIERFTLTPEVEHKDPRSADHVSDEPVGVCGRRPAHSELTGFSRMPTPSAAVPARRTRRATSSPRPKIRDTERAVSQEAGHRDLGQNNKKVVVEGEQPTETVAARENARRQGLTARLVAVGVSQATASALVESHPTVRIVAALEALDVLKPDEVRSPAGWVVAAVRENWDLSALLAQRREIETRQQRLDHEAAKRREAQAAEELRATVISRWCRAVSAALDDAALATAVESVTTPVPGLNRRIPATTRSQLLAWAVGVHQRHPGLSLPRALKQDLERGPTRPSQLPAHLPDPKASPETADDLNERLNALFERQPDLAGSKQPEPQREALSLER